MPASQRGGPDSISGQFYARYATFKVALEEVFLTAIRLPGRYRTSTLHIYLHLPATLPRLTIGSAFP